ncbi:MAG TPA: 2,3-bisphosphoglycerate-independent phosphoglycerate mutase [Chromatiaceae bacterium]|jgi:2,3-bisphosphoglycerate-independent phosphoglycerate mutase|nr:MAG: phosphoglyceromutase [Thiohalocapsa sp. PB-PSB1]QQO55647.1 MAG: 2,3-bisphosphoglycerate-independent phosphoglycerate mutase [Thiohalocapsa sp. PB-PSB1]HBG95145.1 2,3-bisphosphoglycerate-independent phosphoglycerate mutase [Chromatiaceae bacterium]HCS93039.1 2,3-bisphosphoglycerate-independent phosphoglycerate mutase [Chromatiaceae bacterium]
MNQLEKNTTFSGPPGPVVLVVMDGVGIGKHPESDFVKIANTPNLDWLQEHAIYTQIKAHGVAVGLPDDSDMGNSEVGHNAMGCGRVFSQGAALVEQALASGSLFAGSVWQELIANVKSNQSTLHFIGLFSDGNVHSNIEHLEAMLNQAKSEGIATARIHALIDGRDVPPTSALEYVERFERFLEEINADGSVNYCIASGGGRMNITMDRYNADWSMVERGWNAHVRAQGRRFASMRQAIETFREEKPNVLDQDLPAFVIERDGTPVGPIVDGDSVIFFNFRGDRSLEITKAFEAEELSEFDRGPKPNLLYAGMMQYDGDLMVPEKYLVSPPAIDRTMSEYLSNAGVKQLAISETQKFGHVTYFFNGNNSGKFATETWKEIPSDVCPFEQAPRMKADEITDEVVKAIESGEYGFIRLNYPNGDMVGHTGVTDAVKVAIEAVDQGVGRIMQAVKQANGIMVCTADHGNSDDMCEVDKKTGQLKLDDEGKFLPKTAHSLNPVPAIIYDPGNLSHARLADLGNPGIANLAATCIMLLGFQPPEDYTPSLVQVG